MKIEMALDAPSEASAIAERGVFAQRCREFCKFSKIFSVQTHPVGVGGQESEERQVGFCNFQVECLLPLLSDMIVSLAVFSGLFWGSRGTLSLIENLGMSQLLYCSGIILSSLMSW